ncbi:CDP-alcohol phosphatidyltransferase family protein [Candidatus Poribacteria bacterium]|nr:CDP-alcohol phosphatidyltransferase family protein [Candidatus Poribacteria bacterium]MYG08725.1 CDP-alcohol phosphatidyltransferase family protein [Candidatus Poribacteria bacterium]MYK23656.1 CDP-alcohol phosphatidyltransferase family protein [Candidatus Poribacteria bacterium]
MFANVITFSRLFLTFAVIALFGLHRDLDIALIATIALIFALDALDGYIARKRNETSKVGEVLDTVADRIIENTFWIYFTVTNLIPFWMPITVMARGFITDGLQHIVGYPKIGWTHALTRSRISRALSGVTKMLAFTCLASMSIFKNPVVEQGSLILATVAVEYCLLRGLPFFFWERKKHEKRFNPVHQKGKNLIQRQVSEKILR